MRVENKEKDEINHIFVAELLLSVFDIIVIPEVPKFVGVVPFPSPTLSVGFFVAAAPFDAIVDAGGGF